MGIFDTLAAFFGAGGPKASSKSGANNPPEHAVIIHFQYGSTNLQRLFALENKIEEAIARSQVGELDGNEVAVDGSDGFLYLYGPDADKLFEAIAPALRDAPFLQGAEVKMRYGPIRTGAKEVIHILDTTSG